MFSPLRGVPCAALRAAGLFLRDGQRKIQPLIIRRCSAKINEVCEKIGLRGLASPAQRLRDRTISSSIQGGTMM